MIANRSMPSSTVIPVLEYPDVEAAVRWLEDTFGFRRRLTMGNHRAQMQVGDGAVVVAQYAGAAPSNVMVRIADVDTHFRQSLAQGARVIGAPVTFPYGERQYSVIDLGGHCWTFSQSVEDVDPNRWGGELA